MKLPRLFIYLLGALLIINVLQSYFTQLIFDEAYYWHFSQNLDWGYFDHPPMMAYWARLGSIFFNGELGIRFISCLSSLGIFIAIWLMIDHPKKNKHIIPFFVLLFSMTLLNAYGFYILPDTPLLFFTSCFLLTYKKFLSNQSILTSIVLGVFMAALMYSKYHAVLVIFFVLLSNLNLVKNKYAWLAVFVSLACFAPHLYWLYERDFISIQYHLFERSNSTYAFHKNTLGYFVNLIAILGFTFPWVYKALYKTNANNKFTKALLYLIYGVLVFFFVSSFNRQIQAQWVVVISIPLAILAFNHMLDNQNDAKWIIRMGVLNIAIILFLRLGLAYSPLLPIKYENQGNKEWVQKVLEFAGDNPVVFENSYRNAPMYAFYSGKDSYSLNNSYYRQNQYSIDDSESKVQHKKVLHISRYKRANTVFEVENINKSPYYGRWIDNFETFRKLRCILDQKEVGLNTTKELNFHLYNPYNKPIALKKLKFGIAYMNKFKKTQEIINIVPTLKNGAVKEIKAKDSLEYVFTFKKPTKENVDYLRIVISENNQLHGLNGSSIKLIK